MPPRAAVARSRASAPHILPVMLAALLTGACTGADPRATGSSVRVDSAGIIIATYDGADRVAPFAFDERFRLGGSETRPEESFFRVHPSTVGIDDAGNVHVLDAPNYKVVTFDGSGRFLRSVGRQGGGPGELGMPAGLVVRPDGTIGVVDFARRGLVRFAADGEPLPIEPLPGNYFGGHVHATDDGLMLPAQVDADGAQRAEALLHVTAADTTALVVMPVTDAKAIELPSCGMRFSGMPPLFSPTLRWAAGARRTAVASTAGYEVRVFEGDDEVLRVRRSIPPRPATLDLAIAEVGDGMSVRTQGGVRVCEPREVAEQRGFAPVIPVIARLAVAPDGSILVERAGDAAARLIDVFDERGDYLGTLPPGSPFPVAFLPDGRIAAGVTDEFDVTRLVVYLVQRPAPPDTG